MKESTIEKAAVKLAKERDFLTYKFVSPNNKGVPDRIFIKDGNVIFVEFKAPTKVPTALQNHIINEMRLNGAIVHVVDNIETMRLILC
jgi:hypothetical protein